MRIPAKLKLNKFRLVTIPHNATYFSRFQPASMPSSSFTGDENAPMGETKLGQMIETMKEFDKIREEEGE